MEGHVLMLDLTDIDVNVHRDTQGKTVKQVCIPRSLKSQNFYTIILIISCVYLSQGLISVRLVHVRTMGHVRTISLASTVTVLPNGRVERAR